MEKSYKELLKNISTFVFDVDGVFNDGVVLLDSNGEQLRTAYVRDGFAVQAAVKAGMNVAIITGGRNQAVKTRFEGLGVNDVYLGSNNKAEVFEFYLKNKGLTKDEVCYMGDDLPDYPVMKTVGLPCCPADAAPEIKSISRYISHKDGGRGCVRDIIEQTLKLKGFWMKDDSNFIW